MHFNMIEARMNSEKLIEFLKKIRADAGRPIFVIADNARYHHNKLVQHFLKDNDGEIMMGFLPAYSPELNLGEQVWNHAKRKIGKAIIKSKEDMESCFIRAVLLS